MGKIVNRSKGAGRPKGRATEFPGITAFCLNYGYSHQHVREVLYGRRGSARVRGLWAQWQAHRLKR